MGSKVSSSDLEIGVSSSASTAGAEMDTTVSLPMSSQPSVSAPPQTFHALKEKCSLKEETLGTFRDRFQFPKGTRIRLPRFGEKSCAFAHGEVCIYKAAFLCGLRVLVHPFIMELLH